MSLKVRDVYQWIHEIAPFDTAEKWDNSGLLCGSAENEVTGIFCELDLTHAVLDEAAQRGANLIVTHHPILFSGRKNLCEDSAEGKLLCRLVRMNMNLIAAHTNYDKAENGVNCCLARALGVTNIAPIPEDADGYLRIGDHAPVTLAVFAEEVTNALGDVVRVYGDRDKIVRRVALCGGAGGEFAPIALRAGADVYVTGEMRYHDSVDLAAEGLASLHCGHDATERIAIKPLAEGLQNRINELQYHVYVNSNMGVES